MNSWPPSTVLDGTAACLGEYELVDAAYEKPGGPEARFISTELCPVCPISEMCLMFAMTNGEAGTWGATSPNKRTRSGAPSWKRRTVPH